MNLRALITWLLVIGLFPSVSAAASDLAAKRKLSTLQVLYVESLPKEDSKEPLIQILKKFEPADEASRMAETILTTDDSLNSARKLVIDGGFIDLPAPLLAHLTRGFKEKGIDATPIFRSRIRSKEEREEVLKNLESRLGPIPEGGPGKSQHSLLLTPYRIAPSTGNTADLKIGALLYDEINRKWIWFYYVTIKFGGTGARLGDAEAFRVATTVINGMEGDRGWVSTDK